MCILLCLILYIRSLLFQMIFRRMYFGLYACLFLLYMNVNQCAVRVAFALLSLQFASGPTSIAKGCINIFLARMLASTTARRGTWE